MTLETLGWLGGLCFALCALPQAIQVCRQGHGDGLSWTFLALWIAGEIATVAYVWPDRNWPLLTNYFINLILLAPICAIKAWPRLMRRGRPGKG